MKRILLAGLVALTLTTDATAGPLRRLFCRPARSHSTGCQSAPAQRPAYLPATLPVAVQPPVLFAGPVPTLIRSVCAGGVCPR